MEDARGKTVEQVREEVVATFKAGQVEAAASILSTWVVAFCTDATPLRTDGNKIAIFGTSIFSTADKAQARAVARNINLQLGETATVQVEQSGAWRKRRIAQLATFIEQVSAG